MTRIPFSCFKLSLLGRHWSVPLCKFQGFHPMTPHLHPPPSVRPPCGAPDRAAPLPAPARSSVCLIRASVASRFTSHTRVSARGSRAFSSHSFHLARHCRGPSALRGWQRVTEQSPAAHTHLAALVRSSAGGRSGRLHVSATVKKAVTNVGAPGRRGAGARTALRIRVFAFSRWCRMGGRRVARQRSTDC